jgi:phosphate transport system permease protein
VHFAPETLDPEGRRDPQALSSADYGALVREAVQRVFPEVTDRRERRELMQLLSPGAGFELREMVLADPALVGATRTVWLPANDDVDVAAKRGLALADSEAGGRLSARQIDWLRKLVALGALEKQFNRAFFTKGDSREPELAGIWGAAVGSFYTLLVCLLLSFPVGVMAAVYLEEFAPKNRLTDLIEVNINNLAAVPSIVFGLLGLAVFLGFFGLPRSAPLVGGMVLALMSLPTIIIAGRAALKAVPPSIREAALGVGASRLQVVTHHVLPLAMPGLLTGTIIAMAQALGETAPLLMIGMVAFIVDIPGGVFDSATVLPVQIYLWADSPERAFVERTSAAILVLLGFLICMNLAAVLLRRRFEKRW